MRKVLSVHGLEAVAVYTFRILDVFESWIGALSVVHRFGCASLKNNACDAILCEEQ